MKDQINFTSQVWQEGKMFVSYNPELTIASCGKTIDDAKKNLKEAVELFIETAIERNTFKDILEEAGFIKKKINEESIWKAPEFLSLEKISVAF